MKKKIITLTVLSAVFSLQAECICSSDFTIAECSDWAEGARLNVSSDWKVSDSIEVRDVAGQGYLYNKSHGEKTATMSRGFSWAAGEKIRFHASVSRGASGRVGGHRICVGVKGSGRGNSGFAGLAVVIPESKDGSPWALTDIAYSSGLTNVTATAANRMEWSDLTVEITKTFNEGEFLVQGWMGSEPAVVFEQTVVDVRLYDDSLVFAAMELPRRGRGVIGSFRVAKEPASLQVLGFHIINPLYVIAAGADLSGTSGAVHYNFYRRLDGLCRRYEPICCG